MSYNAWPVYGYVIEHNDIKKIPGCEPLLNKLEVSLKDIGFQTFALEIICGGFEDKFSEGQFELIEKIYNELVITFKLQTKLQLYLEDVSSDNTLEEEYVWMVGNCTKYTDEYIEFNKKFPGLVYENAWVVWG